MAILSCAVEAGKLISVCWTRSNYLCAPTNTFFCNTCIKLLYCQKRLNFWFVYRKNNLCRKKLNEKLHITQYYGHLGF